MFNQSKKPKNDDDSGSDEEDKADIPEIQSGQTNGVAPGLKLFLLDNELLVAGSPKQVTPSRPTNHDDKLGQPGVEGSSVNDLKQMHSFTHMDTGSNDNKVRIHSLLSYFILLLLESLYHDEWKIPLVL